MDHKETLKSFGEHLRKIRESKGISQENLGELADIDRTYISSVERGKRNVSIINICKLAKALKITPSALLDFPKDHGVDE